MKFGQINKIVVPTLLTVSLGACSLSGTSLPAVGESRDQAIQETLPGAKIVVLNEANIQQHSPDRAAIPPTTVLPNEGSWIYRVGAGDVLKVIVWGISELNDSSQFIQGDSPTGSVVQANGDVFYPYVGTFNVAGKSVPEIREQLATLLAEYFPEPQVEVRVVEFNSQTAVIAGAVREPARYALEEPPTFLIDLVAKAQQNSETADISRVTIRRDGRTYNVNLDAFVRNGRESSNPLILNGDAVFVPEHLPQKAFVLGEINRASSIDITNRDVSLTQIISEAGGLSLRDADARGVFVFRRTGPNVTVFQLDLSNATAYLTGARFAITGQDVVYVTTDPITRWNRLISDLLPSVNLYQVAGEL